MGHALSENTTAAQTSVRAAAVFFCAHMQRSSKLLQFFHPMVRKRLLVVSDSENFCETSLPDIAITSQDVRDGKAAFAKQARVSLHSEQVQMFRDVTIVDTTEIILWN